ncbi:MULTISPECIES: hypothetical protein [unclassified Streptomyces]|uniref:hypothetical protein n=1 Tax=unclassified Streptomyces TaxID=2593676 RepID=UPI00332F41A2
MSGDSVTQFGNQNIGIIKNQGAVDPQAALQQMIGAALSLREQVSADDRAVIDTALDVIRDQGPADPGRFRQALAGIAGIAALVGEVGAPALGAATRLMEALGLR